MKKSNWPALLFLIGVALLIVGPFLFMVSTSFKPGPEISEVPFRFIPKNPTSANYETAFTRVQLLRGTWNTLLIAVPSTILGLLTSAFAGYAFARMKFPYREQLFGLLMATMTFPAIVYLIPQFVMFAQFGWIDTYLPLIIPGAFGAPFAVFMFRQFFASLPGELMEAAELDGCTPVQTFLIIALPLARPAMATLAILGFKGAWNDYFGPLIYVSSPDRFTLQQMIAGTQNAYGGDPGVLMAAATLAMLPMVLLFFVAQKQFVESVAATGLKG